MSQYYLGADIGSTKTHILIADEDGIARGFGVAGGGNHEGVGYDGFAHALQTAFQQAIIMADISTDQILGGGFGIAGFDWPCEREPTLNVIGTLGLRCPVEAVNDTILGILAGSSNGWGISVVSGTGCNCWGWDETHKRIGQVTGGGIHLGEGAGASELIERVIHSLGYEWARRIPHTELSTAFVRYTGARDLQDLVEGIVMGRTEIDAAAAPLVFKVAENGDQVAQDLIRWAGQELGELAKCVIRQLDFREREFDVVLLGSMFDGGPMLIDTLRQTICDFAPKGNLIRLKQLPVVGGLLLGMETGGKKVNARIRDNLNRSVPNIQR